MIMHFGENCEEIYTLDYKSLVSFINRKISRKESMSKSYGEEMPLNAYVDNKGGNASVAFA
jgi:hypothetical protein